MELLRVKGDSEESKNRLRSPCTLAKVQASQWRKQTERELGEKKEAGATIGAEASMIRGLRQQPTPLNKAKNKRLEDYSPSLI